MLFLGLYKEDYLQIFKCVSFDYTAFVVSGNVGIPQTGLTTPLGWLSLLQLTVISRSASMCYRIFWCRVMLSRCFLEFSVGVGTFVIGLSQKFSFFSYDFYETRGPMAFYRAQEYNQQACSVFLYMKKTQNKCRLNTLPH